MDASSQGQENTAAPSAHPSRYNSSGVADEDKIGIEMSGHSAK